jgi:hypothetical protein
MLHYFEFGQIGNLDITELLKWKRTHAEITAGKVWFSTAPLAIDIQLSFPSPSFPPIFHAVERNLSCLKQEYMHALRRWYSLCMSC